MFVTPHLLNGQHNSIKLKMTIKLKMSIKYQIQIENSFPMQIEI